jgi:hypothetical protein
MIKRSYFSTAALVGAIQVTAQRRGQTLNRTTLDLLAAGVRALNPEPSTLSLLDEHDANMEEQDESKHDSEVRAAIQRARDAQMRAEKQDTKERRRAKQDALKGLPGVRPGPLASDEADDE